MPVTYAFDDSIVVIRMEGQYTVPDLEQAILAGLGDPHRPADAVLMFDLSESRALRDRPTEDVRGMARFLARHRARYGSRLAMVAPSDLAFGLMRLGAVTAEGGGVDAEVFRDYVTARAWLLRQGPPAVERLGTRPNDAGATATDGDRSGDAAPR
jgi:hypothetical protein